MSRAAIRRLGCALLAGVALVSCGGDANQNSNAGDLLLSLYAGGPEAGAVLLVITGGPVQNATALGGQQVSFASPFSGNTRVVISGDLATGDVLRIRVPDLSRIADYHVQTLQVADKVTFALLDQGAYTFTVHR
jgi:hypothetical protein